VKLLHLLGDPADLGGILSVIRCLHEVTAPLGDEHVVWVRQGYQETRRPPLAYRYSRSLLAESPQHSQLLIRAIPAFLELRRLLQAEPFDLVHAHTRGAFPVAVLLASLTRRPVLFTNHTYARRTRLYRLATRLSRFHTVVLTPNMARHYRIPVPSPRVSIIPACCSDRFFRMPIKSAPAGSPPALPIRLIGIGNIVRWKNWHLLIDALASLAPEERRFFRFLHYGEPPKDGESPAYARSLQQQIDGTGLRSIVEFRGSTLDAADCLVQADWFVLPSTNEPCSVALSEAMALGLPALVSASGGNVDLVEHGKTGRLFAPDDVTDLARQLRSLLGQGHGIAAPEEIRRSAGPRRATHVAMLYRDLYHRWTQIRA
jgi:glycosyltransferase involved in cell wall biosynthesis